MEDTKQGEPFIVLLATTQRDTKESGTLLKAKGGKRGRRARPKLKNKNKFFEHGQKPGTPPPRGRTTQSAAPSVTLKMAVDSTARVSSQTRAAPGRRRGQGEER